MFQVAALLAGFLPWLMILALAALIWILRRRRWRALLALVALVLMALINSREVLYAMGLGSFDLEDAIGLSAIRLRIATALEWYGWQILALATVSAALLAWPLPAARGQRVLAVLVVAGLGLSTFMVWSFTGLRLN
jgi:hypothetical protein